MSIHFAELESAIEARAGVETAIRGLRKLYGRNGTWAEDYSLLGDIRGRLDDRYGSDAGYRDARYRAKV